MARTIQFALAALLATPAVAGQAEQIAHGMIVTTDTGEKVRVLAYADGTFRVTVADELPTGRPTTMVVAEPDGSPDFSKDGETAYLRSGGSLATVSLDDGCLTVHDRGGKILLDE